MGSTRQVLRAGLSAITHSFAAATQASHTCARAVSTSAAAAVQAASAPAAGTPAAFVSVTLRDLYKLSKGKLSLIVVSTGAAGFVAGSGEAIEWGRLACTCVGTFACSAAANTLNQVYEIHNDGRMRRTMLRPLPAGRMTVVQALCFAAVTSIGGGALLAYQVRQQPRTPTAGGSNLHAKEQAHTMNIIAAQSLAPAAHHSCFRRHCLTGWNSRRSTP
jgi:heme o synthase